MLTQEQKNQFSEILEHLGKTLDITKEQHEAAVKSYRYVGDWLADSSSPLTRYAPEILPQGSFLIGTMTRPILENDELDIDLVCKFEGKPTSWTQYDLKKAVGDRLKANGILEKLLVIPDRRRCWKLKYTDAAKFHMDVVPSIVSIGFHSILNKAFSEQYLRDPAALAIRITDNQESNYRSSTNPDEWILSGPFGYGLWFEQCATIQLKVL